MSRVYAVEDHTERRVLVRIECDGCDRSVKPGAVELATWEKGGWDNGPGTEKFESYFCPEDK